MSEKPKKADQDKPVYRNQFGSSNNSIQPKPKTKPPAPDPEPEVKEEPIPAKPPEKKSGKGNILAGKVKKKRDAKSYGFFLDNDVVEALEKLAKQNKISTSQALNLILRDLLLDKE